MLSSPPPLLAMAAHHIPSGFLAGTGAGSSSSSGAGMGGGPGGGRNSRGSGLPDGLPDRYSLASTVTSSASASFEYNREFGRLYIAYEAEDGIPYLLPNDEREKERLNFQHYIFRALFGSREFFAPLVNPRRILDIGTGTGKWPIEMAAMFPDAEFTATDLCPLPSDDPPENITFIKEDASTGDWGDRPYSYIHTRMLLGCFEDFRQIIRRSYQYLEPGGWMESQEVYPTIYCDDNSLRENSALVEWTRDLDEAFMELRRPIRIANKLRPWYEDAGFEDVKEEVFKLPLCGWPNDPLWKMIGRLWNLQMMEGLSGYSLRPFNMHYMWSQLETEAYLTGVKAAMMDSSQHLYYKVHVVWGRKPYTATPTPLP